MAAQRVLAEQRRQSRERAQGLYSVLDGWEAADIPQLWIGASIQLVASVFEHGPPEVKTAEDAARLIQGADKLFKMGRLAAGQSTSNAASINVDGTELAGLLRSRLAQLSKDPASDTPPSQVVDTPPALRSE